MSHAFVPLIPAPAPASVPPPNLVPLAPPGGSAALAPTPAPAATPQSDTAHAAPTVSFKRDGDRVTQIEVRCACGEVIQLDCDYNSAAQG